jgi:hypothetical protein
MSWLRPFTGKDSYEFGDITKTIFRKTGSAVSSFTGQDSYEFGDISRTLVHRVGGAVAPHYFTEYQDRQLLRDRPASLAPGATDTEATHAEARPPIDQIWECFFGSCYEDALVSLRVGQLKPAHVLDREAFFFIGLPACTLLGACIRSLTQEDGSFVLSNGLLVRQADVPEPMRPLFDALATMRDDLGTAPPNETELVFLSDRCLFGSTPGSEGGDLTARQQALHRLSGGLQSIATQLSQLPFYKNNFDDILRALDIVATAMEQQQQEEAEAEEARGGDGGGALEPEPESCDDGNLNL